MNDEPQPQQPTEEELRAQLEEQLKQLRVEDVLLQTVVTIVNLTGRKLTAEDEKDLDQAKIGIEAVRALADLIEGEVEPQIRSALSELQILYAKAAKGEPLGGEGADAPEAPPESPQPPPQAPPK